MNGSRYPVTKTECGKALKINAATSNQKAIMELLLASAYPANVPTEREIVMTPKVIIIVLKNCL